MSTFDFIRGDVFLVNLDPTMGSEKKKTRPAVVVQNNLGNKYSSTTIIAPISGYKGVVKELPIWVKLLKGEGGLDQDSFVDCGQIRTVDHEERFIKKLGSLRPESMENIDKALKISLDLK